MPRILKDLPSGLSFILWTPSCHSWVTTSPNSAFLPTQYLRNWFPTYLSQRSSSASKSASHLEGHWSDVLRARSSPLLCLRVTWHQGSAPLVSFWSSFKSLCSFTVSTHLKQWICVFQVRRICGINISWMVLPSIVPFTSMENFFQLNYSFVCVECVYTHTFALNKTKGGE